MGVLTRLWSKTDVVVNESIRLSLYRSTRSRLTVAVGDVPGPVVNGCISFVTETDSDDGLPHTLEHLVFMGSKKYPFKGVLDIIANRCLASGTNASTDQDHTAYTLSTVGSEGFFKVLPVYINHLLAPTLTNAQFATEVHHINEKGDDAGVVYSEMQDHESDMEEIMSRKAKEIIYPPNNPYSVDFGGRLKNLRESCSVDKCREFHKKFYHLSNMLITISGQIDHTRLLDRLAEVEQEHMGSVPTEFPRPFNITLPAIKESSEHRVVAPSDDASRGTVNLHWFAYEPTDFYTHSAMQVMFDYLSNTPVSPLQRQFVLVADPLAGEISFHVSEQSTNEVILSFSGVPIDKLDLIKSKFLDGTVAEHVDADAWDIERMGYLIGQGIKHEMLKMETSAHHQLVGMMIGYQLFDKDDESMLKQRVDEVSILRRLSTEPASFWASLMKKYFTKPCVTIIGVPDEKLADKIATEEDKRLKQQRKTLGKEGLTECEKKLKDAIHENTVNKPSQELLNQLIVKKLENFASFPVKATTNRGDKSALSKEEAYFLEQFPFHTTLHNCPTKFVELYLLLDSVSLSLDDRKWLQLYTDMLFQSPCVIDGKLRSAEDVAKLHTKDLVDLSVQYGVKGYFDRFICIRLKVPADETYGNLSKWAEILTCGLQFDAERVAMRAQKLASDAREHKRDGCTVASTTLGKMVYLENTNTHLCDDMVLEKVHEKIAKQARTNPEWVIQRLEQLRRSLFASGVNVHMVCDVSRVDEKLCQPDLWKWATKTFGPTAKFPGIPGEGVNAEADGKQQVISVGGSESSFVYASAPLDCDWRSEHLVPTMLFAQYLSQTEGPMWRGIRGDGLAYGANVYVQPDRKRVKLELYRCAQPSQAFARAQTIIDEVVKNGLDESEFEAAKRSLIFETVSKEDTVSEAGKMSIVGTFREYGPDFNRAMCQRIWNATTEETLRVGAPRIQTIFEKSAKAIAVHPSKIGEMKKSFPGIETVTMASIAVKASECNGMPENDVEKSETTENGNAVKEQ